MNPFEIMFCWGPLLLGLGLPTLYMLSLIASRYSKARADRLAAEHRRRLLEMKEAEERRRAELQEARIAKVNNDVVLQEQKMDLLELKIRHEKREQGLLSQPFTPDDPQPKE